MVGTYSTNKISQLRWKFHILYVQRELTLPVFLGVVSLGKLRYKFYFIFLYMAEKYPNEVTILQQMIFHFS